MMIIVMLNTLLKCDNFSCILLNCATGMLNHLCVRVGVYVINKWHKLVK